MYAWVSHRPHGAAETGRALGGGWLVPAAAAAVPVLDRGFLLGDGLFESVRVAAGRLPLWDRHRRRLEEGCRLLGMPSLPWDLEAAAAGTVEASGLADGVLRITVTRGSGPRGYDPPSTAEPFCAMTVHPLPAAGPGPQPWRAVIGSVPQWPHPVLGRVKHLSALPRILARQEARSRGADEALLLTPEGAVAEGVATNVFWVAGGRLCTPALSTGCLPGVARAWVMDWARTQGVPVTEGTWSPAAMAEADEVFFTNAVAGPIPVAEVAGVGRWPAPGPWTARLMEAWNHGLRWAAGGPPGP